MQINQSLIETVAKCRGAHQPLVRRADALEIFAAFGLTEFAFRKARLNGDIQGRTITKGSNEYYLRDQLIQLAAGKHINVLEIQPTKS